MLSDCILFLPLRNIGSFSACPLYMPTLRTSTPRSRVPRLKMRRKPTTPTTRFLYPKVAISGRALLRSELLHLLGRPSRQASLLPRLLPPFLVEVLPTLSCWMMKMTTFPQALSGVARQVMTQKPQWCGSGISVPKPPRMPRLPCSFSPCGSSRSRQLLHGTRPCQAALLVMYQRMPS